MMHPGLDDARLDFLEPIDVLLGKRATRELQTLVRVISKVLHT